MSSSTRFDPTCGESTFASTSVSKAPWKNFLQPCLYPQPKSSHHHTSQFSCLEFAHDSVVPVLRRTNKKPNKDV